MIRSVGRTFMTMAVVTLGLGACELPEWLGEAEEPPLPGERISVLSLEQRLEPDPAIADLAVQLPRPWRNANWPQQGGLPTHVMYHVEGAENPQLAWNVDVGAGSDDEERLLARPIAVDGRVFVLDALSVVGAFDAETGRNLWRKPLTPEKEEEGALGGGLAYADGTLFVTTGYGYVHALDPATGEARWRQRIGPPLRSAPTAGSGRVFAITYDNQLHVLAAENGRTLWQHNGIPEDAGLIGSPSAALEGSTVLVPYTSGELYALRVDNGRVLWSDQLVRTARVTPLSELSEIGGSPAVDGGVVVALSHSGRLAAIDLRSGARLWDNDIAGVETPWIAGSFVYLITTQSEIVCLELRSGRIRWVTELQRYENEERKTDPIKWSGPVLVSDRLLAVSSHGYAVSISPYSGALLGQQELPSGSSIAPIVADGTIYVLTDSGRLLALR